MAEPKQDQRSQQSMNNPEGGSEQPPSADTPGKKNGTAIGSSQGQDRERRSDRDSVPHTGRDTADIERSSAGGQGSSDSLTDDPVGAYKERP